MRDMKTGVISEGDNCSCFLICLNINLIVQCNSRSDEITIYF